MKQKSPDIFTDLCLYSEVCLLLSEYSFRLFSRRFLQELFMDVDFEELYAEPMKILRLDVRSNGDMKEGICEEPNEERKAWSDRCQSENIGRPMKGGA